MTYKEAGNIFSIIKKADKILLVLHNSPDPDSIGANLAMHHALLELGKKSVAILSTDPLPKNLTFLPGADKVKQDDVAKTNLLAFDLFICLDVSDPKMLTRQDQKVRFPPGLEVIVIDHHFTNSRFGKINLVDDKIGSTAELLHSLLKVWKVRITKDIATCLLTGLLGDTANFKFGTTTDTLEVAGGLVKIGAKIKDINFNLYRRVPIENLRFWGSILSRLKVEKVGKYTFGWAAMSYAEFRKLGGRGARESVATMFFSTIEGTDFGVVLVEESKGQIRGSLRSRTDMDVASLALLFGGGGHKAAAGFGVLLGKENFDDKVKKILDVIKKSLRKNDKHSFLGKND